MADPACDGSCIFDAVTREGEGVVIWPQRVVKLLCSEFLFFIKAAPSGGRWPLVPVPTTETDAPKPSAPPKAA